MVIPVYLIGPLLEEPPRAVDAVGAVLFHGIIGAAIGAVFRGEKWREVPLKGIGSRINVRNDTGFALSFFFHF